MKKFEDLPVYYLNGHEHSRAVKYASQYCDKKSLTVLLLIKAMADRNRNEITRLEAEYKKLFGKKFKLDEGY